jgi:hypothetical protein
MSTFPYLVAKSAPRYEGFLGAIVVRMDVDKRGNAGNISVLTAIPENVSTPKMLNYLERIRFTKGKPWDSSCSLERANYTLTIQFSGPPG